MKDKEIIYSCIEKVKKFSPNDNDISLSNGLSGKLMAFSILNESKYEIVNIAQVILDEISSNSYDLTFFNGLSGVDFAFAILNKKYDVSNVINKITKIILSNYSFPKSTINIFPFEYDLIYGCTGIANLCTILLKSDFLNNNLKKESLNFLENYINYIYKIQFTQFNKHQPWWISSQNQMIKSDKIKFENGCYNLGIAHGILGIILCMLRIYDLNINKDFCELIIKSLISELLSFKNILKGKIFFPPRATDENEIKDEMHFLLQDGWCYGNLSVGYTLLKANKIIKEDKLQLLADSLIENSLVDVKELSRNLKSPIICHGKSGFLLLLISMLQNNLFKKNKILSEINNISSLIRKQHSKSSKFGFVDEELQKNNVIKIDNMGILEGSLGIILSLNELNHLNSKLSAINWKDMFLL